MRLLIYSDVHWSTYTSNVHSRGDKYSTRLELLIKSMNWAEELATKANCNYVFCLGDFFDKPVLEDEEINALNEINWNKNVLAHYFIVGNHESRKADLCYSTTSLLSRLNFNIISEPEILSTCRTKILMLPYTLDGDRKSLAEYWYITPDNDKMMNIDSRIIMSHNDISGIRYGAFESKSGVNIKEIEDNCDLYLNGHLHNGEFVSDKVLNVGSLTAHNFTNDSYKYSYGCWVLDTDTGSLDFYENPYSLNFYKLEVNNDSDLSKLDNLKSNAVVSVKCKDTYSKIVTEKLSNCLEHKVIRTFEDVAQNDSNDASELSVNHLDKFRECCIEKIGADDVVMYELSEVCK